MNCWRLGNLGSVEDYTKEFEALKFQVSMHNPGYDEIFFASQFVKGLKDKLRGTVHSQVPDTVDRASMLARVHQQVLDRSKFKGGRGSPPVKLQTSTGRPDQKPSTQNTSLWRERQLRDYRRANNLCYFYGEKFDHAHLEKCTKRPKPQMNAIVVNDLDMPLSEETLNQLEVEDVLAQELGQLSIYALAGTESKDSMRVGVAAFDLRSASLHLSQYIETSCSYHNTKTLLHFYDPMVIIVPPNKTAADGMVGVSELVGKHYPAKKKVTDIKLTLFSDRIRKGCIYYQPFIIISFRFQVTFNGSFDHMNIDSTSVQTLEIIDPLHTELWGTSNKKKSLFQMLKATKTTGGARLLRANLLQPLKDIQTINARLDCLVSRSEMIGEVIDEDVVHSRAPFIACTQQCFAVKAGIDGLLDVARRSFCDTSEVIFVVLLTLLIDLMNVWGTIKLLPEKRGLIDEIREDVGILTLLAEVLCLLDMIVNSFAHTISTKPVNRYTRPEFTDDGPMAINAGRHPILEGLHTDFVPNNIFLSEASNMVLVMGPNMSGKSTYLQQICLIVILAQMGCYVPAQFASLRVFDRIFTRIGNGDNVENNSSTFMTEMKETAFIMQNVSSKSLIVVDELGRATSSSDGLAIAWSCCEYLLSIKAYTVFATHMEGLSELSTMYPNVRILHFEVDLRNDRLDFKFRLKDGVRRVPHYGLRLARVAGLPASVIDTATSITSRVTEQEMARMDANSVEFRSLQTAYMVGQRLVCLKYSNQGDDYVREALKSLKESIAAGRLT
ncbi:hypothetical protein PR202_ga25264 [Eleusine coracana subsp. coracana]|uniref:DNA mismatch repair proteins mutS family domain-containing protein n=1 Tax=Eleusine coracana subsp. coracana TaxID=191504 RepID=A0AAV5DAW3_ELECO|nr:hypothetical protein PR202_ga25264 [Eleusine coracana subsp. coracana]